MAVRVMLVAAAMTALAACGGGGDGAGTAPSTAATSAGGVTATTTASEVSAKIINASSAADESGPALRPLALSPRGSRITTVTPNSVTLQSDPGDYIGRGKNYTYSNANASFSVTTNRGKLSFVVTGDQNWRGDFALPSTLLKLQPGTYGNLTRFGFHVPTAGGLNWSGEGRGCNTLTGSLTIDSVSFRVGSDALEAIDLSFEQHCEGDSVALRGQIHWSADDRSSASGPVNPPPAGLWAPAPGVTPASGSYVYLVSDTGDFVGQGRSYTYSRANASLVVTANGGGLALNVTGDQNWRGDFIAMNTVPQLRPGYYGNLQRFPFHNPSKGGLNWSGDGRGCNTLQGWFVVDAVVYSGSQLKSIDLRFEQHCEGGAPALRGQIHWTLDDENTVVPGPVNPPPTGLWAPPDGETPASGSYVYLVSDAADFVGRGRKYVYTRTNASLAVTANGGTLSVNVAGDQNWNGGFAAMSTVAPLQPGYYGDLQRYPFHNPIKGGLSWSGDGRGCNTLKGWFVVDAVSYSGTQLRSIDLRFEQHCEGDASALRGKIHWIADDTSTAPGPINPPPAGLWAPAAGATPSSGSYVYLVSEPGDFVGEGKSYTYSGANASLGVTTNGGKLSLNVTGDQNWRGDFAAMNTLTLLQPGYYGDLQRYPFHNAVKGGLSWSGEGRGCNTLKGWFVVDAITYTGSQLRSVDLRFEQHCEGEIPALRGQIHWTADDNTTPPGPVNPPPANLWAPAAGATPSTGNFIYLASDSGDWVGGGQSALYTPASSTVTVNANGGHLWVTVGDVGGWRGDFVTMNSLTQLQPGYYGDLQRYPFHNPVKGGLSWYGNGRGCNTLRGWFAVDAVTYVGSELKSIDLRFEQHCEGGSAALRGRIRWGF
ncbi:hypothetical protein QTH89_02445 [Variovorax sp. J22G21]|uniref:hypothetical protein n=1 Tax=Variovorax fucosicus TaxID=3053517 RepID=UPI002578DB50|nr:MULTISPECIES: hypothetical protein [unclassified Variovorax]MDM0040998.1 hypothetical protein [Variovorax sp. J22R193]MDM0060055.1 hypothetical protein [Variovorax sp. J22G21]